MNAPSHELQHYYRRFRQHQIDTYGDSGLWVEGRSARQCTGGGSAYGHHAESAINSARSQIYFRRKLAAMTRR